MLGFFHGKLTATPHRLSVISYAGWPMPRRLDKLLVLRVGDRVAAEGILRQSDLTQLIPSQKYSGGNHHQL
jgi:hypothetical protein